MSVVETKDVELPDSMQWAMARQAEAEWEKRAKIIHASGELAAAQQLADASTILTTNPAGLQARYLQTLTDGATKRNSTLIFPIPIDFLTPFLPQHGGGCDAQSPVAP